MNNAEVAKLQRHLLEMIGFCELGMVAEEMGLDPTPVTQLAIEKAQDFEERNPVLYSSLILPHD